MSDSNNDVENNIINYNNNKEKNTRLGWKSRCREMQAIRWGKKSKTPIERENGRSRFLDEIPFNEEFDRYYKDQKICKENEWNIFVEYSKRTLPVSFRLNTSSYLWKEARDKLKQMCNSNELELQPCVDYCLDYLKNQEDYNIFYQMKADKSSLRKDDKFAKFHKFLMNEDNRGSLCRQETVSMLPVIFLNPKPNENILDLCAAPGMKYLQIVDMVESRLKAQGLDSVHNKGIIVGNDVSQTRVSTLSHHLKTIDSPSTSVTNYDATRFPNLYNKSGEQILFDKILADMPCSCDGTMRKSMDIWTNWKATNGLHLHKVQLTILKRGIDLLKPGGELVYSTCSLNPLENEAIANYCLTNEEIELVDLEPLKGFKFESGLLEWLVPDLQGEYYREYSEVDSSLHERIKKTMFKSELWTQETAKKVMRVLPHYNNTGGFFIFKIRKKATDLHLNGCDLNHKNEMILEEHDERKLERKKSRGAKLLHEFIPFGGDEYDRVMEFYGIEKKLNFLVKISSDKSVHLVCDSESVIGYKRSKNNKYELCKYASLGTRAFTKLDTKQEVRCEYRLTQEGSKVLHRYVNKRKIICNVKFIKIVLESSVSLDIEEIKKHEKEGNLTLEGCKDKEGNIENGPLLIVIIMKEKEYNREERDKERKEDNKKKENKKENKETNKEENKEIKEESNKRNEKEEYNRENNKRKEKEKRETEDKKEENNEEITLAAVMLSGKFHLYIKEELQNSLKALL